MCDYEGTRRIAVDWGGDIGTMLFLPVCPICSRFVKADKRFRLEWGPLPDPPDYFPPWCKPKEPNATCAMHGRVAMPWEYEP